MGAGKPVAVTFKENVDPIAAVAVLARAMAGGWSTFKVNLWLAVPEVLAAVMVME